MAETELGWMEGVRLRVEFIEVVGGVGGNDLVYGTQECYGSVVRWFGGVAPFREKEDFRFLPRVRKLFAPDPKN